LAVKASTFGLAYVTDGNITDELFPETEGHPDEFGSDLVKEDAELFLCGSCDFVSGRKDSLQNHFSSQHSETGKTTEIYH
jgi:hypothetical protein